MTVDSLVVPKTQRAIIIKLLAHRRVTTNEKQNHEPNSVTSRILAFTTMAQDNSLPPTTRRKRRHAHRSGGPAGASANYGLGFLAPFFLKTEKAPSPTWVRWHIHCALRRAEIFLGCGRYLISKTQFVRKTLFRAQHPPGLMNTTDSKTPLQQPSTKSRPSRYTSPRQPSLAYVQTVRQLRIPLLLRSTAIAEGGVLQVRWKWKRRRRGVRDLHKHKAG